MGTKTGRSVLIINTFFNEICIFIGAILKLYGFIDIYRQILKTILKFQNVFS